MSPQRLGGPGGRSIRVQRGLSGSHGVSPMVGSRVARRQNKRTCPFGRTVGRKKLQIDSRMGIAADSGRGLSWRHGTESHPLRLSDHPCNHFLLCWAERQETIPTCCTWPLLCHRIGLDQFHTGRYRGPDRRTHGRSSSKSSGPGSHRSRFALFLLPVSSASGKCASPTA